MSTKPVAPELLLAPATLSFPNLFVPRVAQVGSPAKFGCALIYQPSEEGLLNDAKQECAKLLLAQYGANWLDAVKAGQLFWPFKKITGLAVKEGYPEGGTLINPNSNADSPPHLFDRYQDPATGKAKIVTDPKHFYAGCKVVPLVRPYLFGQQQGALKKGVTLGLQALQWWADGPRLDGRSNPVERFGAEPAPAASMPSAAAGTAQTTESLDAMLGGVDVNALP